MLVVDAQVHIWGADTPERPWPPGGAQRAQKPYPVTKEMVLAGMKEAGVDRVVIVPPSWEGDRNDLALEAARLHPDRFAVMGRLAVEKPESRALVAGWRAAAGHARHALHLQHRRAAAVAHRRHRRLAVAGRGARGHSDDGVRAGLSSRPWTASPSAIPASSIVIDHLAIRSGAKGDQAFAGLPELCGLARRANVAVKASALPCYSARPIRSADVHPHIRRVYDAFGPRRMFWGTDWTRLPCPWRQAVTLFTEELPWLPAEDREWIMGRGLCEWLGWPAA